MLREASEPTTLDESSYADCCAATALYVRAAFGGNGVVRLHPNCSCAQSDRPLRRMSACASLRDKGLMRLDVMHVPSPNQQRIGRVRGALIAVTTAFDNQAQIVFVCKAHRGSNITGISGRYPIHTWLGGLSIYPTERLRYTKLVANVVGVFKTLENILALHASPARCARCEGKIDRKQISSDGIV